MVKNFQIHCIADLEKGQVKAMTEQEYKEICAEVQNSGIPVPSQQKIIDACGKQVGKKPIPDRPLEKGKVICWSCPNCGKAKWNGYYFPPLTFDKVCTDCLQAIDWSDEE